MTHCANVRQNFKQKYHIWSARWMEWISKRTDWPHGGILEHDRLRRGDVGLLGIGSGWWTFEQLSRSWFAIVISKIEAKLATSPQFVRNSVELLNIWLSTYPYRGHFLWFSYLTTHSRNARLLWGYERIRNYQFTIAKHTARHSSELAFKLLAGTKNECVTLQNLPLHDW